MTGFHLVMTITLALMYNQLLVFLLIVTCAVTSVLDIATYDGSYIITHSHSNNTAVLAEMISIVV